jgi:NAD+ kinase
MANIFVVAHHTRTEIPGLVADLRRWSSERGHFLWMHDVDAQAVNCAELSDSRHAMDADLVVSLGGDGTVLRAVHMLDGAPVPILGVNVGTIGYLTEIEPDELLDALNRWETGTSGTDYVIDARMMLNVTLHKADGSGSVSWRALNEAVLEKHQSGHTVWLDLVINGQDFARYSADGVIVSTPTGSTAYSMSARGPVVSPRHRALLITPVSPHMLFDRSLVLDPHESVHIKVVGTRPVDLAIDGRGVASLTQDDLVVYAPDTCQAIFVRLFKEPKFHQIVRAKFGLGED